MADWFIATEGVKVVKDSASLWPQIITAVLSAGTAFGGVWYGQWRITQREEDAATAKLVSERLFIATELVFLLERFAQRCAPAATATVEHDQDGRGEAEFLLPEIDYSPVSGNWRSLPITLNPAVNRGVIDIHSAFSQHLLQLTVTDAVFAVPAYGPQNDVTLKIPAFEWVHVQLHQ